MPYWCAESIPLWGPRACQKNDPIRGPTGTTFTPLKTPPPLAFLYHMRRG